MTSKPASSKSAGKRAAEARGRDAGGGGGGAFAKWLRDNKVELDGVEVARFARTGRGVRATRDLRVGEVVVSVPDDAVLTVDACAVKKELGEFVGDGDDEAPSPRLDKELLVIAVMCEMCAGKSSAWCEYLETVHEAVRVGHSVLAWDDEQVTALFGTDAWRDAYENDDETLDLPMMTEEHFENVVTLFFKLFPKLASGLSVEALRELHFAATAMVAGYSFTLGDDEIQAMVPFWDMLNHAPPCEASVRLHHDQKNGCLQMITVRGVKKGEEVFNTYGPLRNAELLRRYGFVLPRNPHGGTTVGLAEVIQAAMGANPLVVDELPLRLAWLESRGLADEELSTRFFVHRTGRPSDKLLIAMRLLTLKPEEMTALIEADFDDEEQLMLLEGNDEERTEQSYMVGASLQFLGMYAKSRYAESMKASRLTYQMYTSVSPHVQKHESIYRAWAAAVVRMDEQRALTKLGRWTYHPGRSEDALLHAWPFPVADEDETAPMMCEPVEG
jgi:SET domain-containing protein 6